MDDHMIVDLYLARDESAIEQTAEKYGRRIRSLALGIVNDFESAEECENDTYVRAWNAIPPNEPREHFFAFLARIARNLALDICRDRGRLKRKAYLVELSSELEQCIPDPDDEDCRLDRMELQKAINGFLATLSEEKRNVFLRRYWFMDPVSEIAHRYNFTENKVKMMLFHTREQMRDYLVKEGITL